MIKLETYVPAGTEEKVEQLLSGKGALLAEAKTGEAVYQDSQDWLDTEICADDAQIERILAKAAEIQANADAFVLIGVGGSNNSARSVIEALTENLDGPAIRTNKVEIIYAGNTLAPHEMTKLFRKLEGKDFYIDCIAKNFETLEPGSSFRILREYMAKRYTQAEAAKRTIATGTIGSSLHKMCEEQGYDFFDFPLNVGGRYTAITNVGLLPMAVAGVDIRALVKGAHDMQVEVHEKEGLANTAWRYAGLRNIFYGDGLRLEMLSSFEPRFRHFYKWWEQLFAESEGKDNLGLFPVTGEFSEELHSVGQFIQDGTPVMFETFLDVAETEDSYVVHESPIVDYFDYLNNKDFREINRAAMEATIKAHSEKLPCLRLTIGKLDAYNFGQLFYFFAFACYLSCKLMGVNAFNQPGVEAYKVQMFDALGKGR